MLKFKQLRCFVFKFAHKSSKERRANTFVGFGVEFYSAHNKFCIHTNNPVNRCNICDRINKQPPVTGTLCWGREAERERQSSAATYL